jgi:hypothetical protein
VIAFIFADVIILPILATTKWMSVIRPADTTRQAGLRSAPSWVTLHAGFRPDAAKGNFVLSHADFERF